ncbi:MAG TPA: zinc-dependent alcohol dehydrogenase family protein [Thermoanaerobaculia bacterium]|nr:zinc-dependent alcohol dehydrogenase family protein [Thermoanaerobaculia bacterium]
MRAMVLEKQRARLSLREVPAPIAGDGQLLIRVDCCAVCRTDLHVVDAELEEPKLPLIIGHQIVGRVVGENRRVGVPWLAWTCGVCGYCKSGRENLCDRALFTGYTVDGGYAEYAVADERYCFDIPSDYTSEEASPLLCAGLIGFRAYRMCGEAQRIGFYGYGSSARILIQIARDDGREAVIFTRDNAAERTPLDAAIIFAPAGELVVNALRNVVKGGVVVCAGIHMSDIPSFPYELLWGERIIRSVANLTREDGRIFFERIRALRIETQRTNFPLEQANEALDALRSGDIQGTAVITI